MKLETFIRKPLMMLMVLEKPMTISEISNAVPCTYAHTLEKLRYFKRRKLITQELRGRNRINALTSKGEKVRQALLKMKDNLRNGS